MKINRFVMLAVLFLLLVSVAPARAAHSMRHDGMRVQVGDSVADLAGQFGEPKMKIDLGELDEGWRKCKVVLWVYEWFPWRYELKVGQGKILDLKKIRLRKVRRR